MYTQYVREVSTASVRQNANNHQKCAVRVRGSGKGVSTKQRATELISHCWRARARLCARAYTTCTDAPRMADPVPYSKSVRIQREEAGRKARHTRVGFTIRLAIATRRFPGHTEESVPLHQGAREEIRMENAGLRGRAPCFFFSCADEGTASRRRKAGVGISGTPISEIWLVQLSTVTTPEAVARPSTLSLQDVQVRRPKC